MLLMIAARSVALVTLQAGDSAHCSADAIVQTSPLDVDCVAFVPSPTGTQVATLMPTATTTSTLAPTLTATWTPLPPTLTPTITPTPLPRTAWPLCPTFNTFEWNELDDPARQCHYDFESGDNPALADAIFGPVGAAWGGPVFGFPWHTSPFEMTLKRGGMKVAVKLNMPCDVNASYDAFPHVNCIKNARVIYHTVGHAMDTLGRYHSYYLEYQVCRNPDFNLCGILKIGGWMDLGVLNAPYVGPRIFRPGGTVDFGLGSTYGGSAQPLVLTYAADTPDLNQIPCCFDEPYTSMGSSAKPLDGNKLIVWSMNNVGQANHFGSNPFARFLVRTFDAWGDIDPANPNAPRFFCRDGSCANNGSNRGLGETSVWIPSTWDMDADGFADASGYTNRLGQIVVGCAAVSLDCVPFEAVHVPVGYGDTRDPGNGSGAAHEYDTSPAGLHWIQFPN